MSHDFVWGQSVAETSIHGTHTVEVIPGNFQNGDERDRSPPQGQINAHSDK